MLDAASAEDGMLKDGRREIVCVLAELKFQLKH